jgi:putative tricarboxylic transport membrane protein
VNWGLKDMSLRHALLGIALMSAVLSIIYLVTSLQYPMDTAAQPGPGFYPFIVGILWLLSSLGLALEARTKEERALVSWPQGVAFFRIIAIVGSLLFYVILLPVLGHVIVAAVVILVALQAMGGLRWQFRIALTILLTLGSYYLFDVLLEVPLPRGVFFG